MKRFHDTGIWDKSWFYHLSPTEKLAFFYIKDKCDNVGVWAPNIELAEVQLGGSIDWPGLVEKSNGNIHLMENGKWWVVDFCDFQHPDLQEGSKSKPVNSYISLLKKHGLWDVYCSKLKGMDTLSIGYKEKEQDRVRVKEEEESGKIEKIQHPTLSLPLGKTRWERIVNEYGLATCDSYLDKILRWEDAKKNGKRQYKDYAAACEDWLKRDKVEKSLTETGGMVNVRELGQYRS